MKVLISWGNGDFETPFDSHSYGDLVWYLIANKSYWMGWLVWKTMDWIFIIHVVKVVSWLGFIGFMTVTTKLIAIICWLKLLTDYGIRFMVYKWWKEQG